MQPCDSDDSQMTNLLTFIMAFVKNPLQVASIVPSSRYLLRRLVDVSGIDSATTIVELGSGNGGSTRAILQAAPAHARLLSIEVNTRLHALTRNIDDKRLISHLGDARYLKEILLQYGLAPPDVIISGIPFSTMKAATASHLLEDISTLLAPGGRFVAYQVSTRVAALARPFMGKEHMEVEIFNIPPMRVYRWKKTEKSGHRPERNPNHQNVQS